MTQPNSEHQIIITYGGARTHESRCLQMVGLLLVASVIVVAACIVVGVGVAYIMLMLGA